MYTQEVCELFDVRVLHDIEPLSAADEDDLRVKNVVAIGDRADHSAGLMGFTMTPWFENYDDLEAFCQRNIDKFREAAVACDAGTACVPDATAWS